MEHSFWEHKTFLNGLFYVKTACIPNGNFLAFLSCETLNLNFRFFLNDAIDFAQLLCTVSRKSKFFELFMFKIEVSISNNVE